MCVCVCVCVCVNMIMSGGAPVYFFLIKIKIELVWGGVGVRLTTAKNKLFLYRVLPFDFCFNLKKIIIQYG